MNRWPSGMARAMALEYPHPARLSREDIGGATNGAAMKSQPIARIARKTIPPCRARRRVRGEHDARAHDGVARRWLANRGPGLLKLLASLPARTDGPQPQDRNAGVDWRGVCPALQAGDAATPTGRSGAQDLRSGRVRRRQVSNSPHLHRWPRRSTKLTPRLMGGCAESRHYSKGNDHERCSPSPPGRRSGLRRSPGASGNQPVPGFCRSD